MSDLQKPRNVLCSGNSPDDFFAREATVLDPFGIGIPDVVRGLAHNHKLRLVLTQLDCGVGWFDIGFGMLLDSNRLHGSEE